MLVLHCSLLLKLLIKQKIIMDLLQIQLLIILIQKWLLLCILKGLRIKYFILLLCLIGDLPKFYRRIELARSLTFWLMSAIKIIALEHDMRNGHLLPLRYSVFLRMYVIGILKVNFSIIFCLRNIFHLILEMTNFTSYHCVLILALW